GRTGRDVSGVPYRGDRLTRAVRDVREHHGTAPPRADRIHRSAARRRARQVTSLRSDAMRPLVYLTLVLSTGCASAGARQPSTPAPVQAPASQAAAESMSVDRAQYPSTYRRHPNPPVLIRNATIMTATGQEIRNGSILFKDGRIVAVGEKVDAPADAAVVDGAGKYVTPGLIDDHSHLGVYGRRGGPATRMGNMAGYRSAFTQAETYRRRWDTWRKDHKGDPPERNLRLETLAEVLRGNMYVQNHCYRADEMAQMIDLAHEFGFKIRSFHHAVESYKIADLLAKEGTSVSVWADWWGFKEEAMDGIQQNAALNQHAGGRPLIHSDSPSGIQRLNQEAAKAMYAGVRA